VSAGLVSIIVGALLAACGEAPPAGFQGYVEGEYVLVAPAQGGQLDGLHVKRGQAVAPKAPLFELDHVAEAAAVREAAERVRSAEARASNLDAPRRAAELQALRQQIAQAEAAHALVAQQLRRAEELQPSGAMAMAELDAARRNLDQQTARKAELQASLGLARESIGRDPERVGAQADADTARAVLAQSEWRLAQRSMTAPAGAVVQDTYYTAGEWVPAGKPVLSLLPPENVKLRFFVPEPVVGSLKLGKVMSFQCDGCGAPMVATISHVSTQAEYTPPILYNRQSRAKLVVMVEARPATADAARLHPGQPVDVTVAAQ
jgi:HlyD family secretion protein